MALVKCKECGHDVSSSAATCPNCGTRTRRSPVKTVLLGIGIFIAATYVLGLVTRGSQEREAQEKARAIEAERLRVAQQEAKAAAIRANPSVPVPAEQVPTQSATKAAKFPDVVAKFIRMNKLKQDAFAAGFHGTVLSGSGRVFEVGGCEWTDDSEKWGGNCLKVTLDKGTPRVVLYFGEKDKAEIASYNKGQAMQFTDCMGISIKNWGFWSTATCDMP